MKRLCLWAVCAGCSPAKYVPPDLSGLTINMTGIDGPSPADDGGAVDAGQATLAADRTTLPFGTVVTHQKSVSSAVVVSNSGDPSLIGEVTIGGPTAFVVVSDGCTGQVLAGAATCTVELRFAPEAAGAATATLTFGGSADGLATVGLTGNGADAGAIQLTPASAPFGSVVTMMTADLSLTLSNQGSIATGAISVDVSGPDAAQFHVIANNCAGGLAASGTCTLSLRLAPTATGALSATLAASDAFGGTVTAALSGTGT